MGTYRGRLIHRCGTSSLRQGGQRRVARQVRRSRAREVCSHGRTHVRVAQRGQDRTRRHPSPLRVGRRNAVPCSGRRGVSGSPETMVGSRQAARAISDIGHQDNYDKEVGSRQGHQECRENPRVTGERLLESLTPHRRGVCTVGSRQERPRHQTHGSVVELVLLGVHPPATRHVSGGSDLHDQGFFVGVSRAKTGDSWGGFQPSLI